MELKLSASNPSGTLSGYPGVDPNPLTGEDILAECDIQKLAVDIAAGSCGVILDLKGSLFFDDANVAVVTAEGVRSATWSGDRKAHEQKYQAFYIGRSALVGLGDNMWKMWLGAINGQELTLEAQTISIWLGNVSWGDAAPPAYDEESDEDIDRNLYQWDTLAVPTAWTSTDLI